MGSYQVEIEGVIQPVERLALPAVCIVDIGTCGIARLVNEFNGRLGRIFIVDVDGVAKLAVRLYDYDAGFATSSRASVDRHKELVVKQSGLIEADRRHLRLPTRQGWRATNSSLPDENLQSNTSPLSDAALRMVAPIIPMPYSGFAIRSMVTGSNDDHFSTAKPSGTDISTGGLGMFNMSHSRIVPSRLALAREVPSGENATEVTIDVCPSRVAWSWPMSGSHSRTVPSSLALAREVPSGENATDHIQSVCPSRVVLC